MFDSREKIAVFIDGPNTYAATRALGFELDFKRLQRYFAKQAYLLRCHYYTTLPDDEEFSSIRPLIDFLDYNGFLVVTKQARMFTDDQGRRKIRGSMHVELCVDMFELSETMNHLVLFSGDGDYSRLIAALQRQGNKVSVVSTLRSQTPMVADDLRKLADHFIELDSLRAHIGRGNDA